MFSIIAFYQCFYYIILYINRTWLVGSCKDFFSKLFFSKISFRNTIRVSNSLDPDQDGRSVGPDLDSICLQRLSADNK